MEKATVIKSSWTSTSQLQMRGDLLRGGVTTFAVVRYLGRESHKPLGHDFYLDGIYILYFFCQEKTDLG